MSEGDSIYFSRCEKLNDFSTGSGSRQSKNYHVRDYGCLGCRVEELEQELTKLRAFASEAVECIESIALNDEPLADEISWWIQIKKKPMITLINSISRAREFQTKYAEIIQQLTKEEK